MPIICEDPDGIKVLTDGAKEFSSPVGIIHVYASIKELENAVQASDRVFVGGYHWHVPFECSREWLGCEFFFDWLQEFLGHKREARFALYREKFRVLTFSDIYAFLKGFLLPFR